MFINNFDPVAFQIMSFEIRWYSLAYILGIVFGWLLCKKIFIQKSDIGEKFDDFVTYLIIGIIIGGRLGYVIFYNFDYYISNIFDIFKVWQGGMSFHGGLLGIIIASVLFAKSIALGVPISYLFFLPFFLFKQLGFNFWIVYFIGILLIIAGFFIHKFIMNIL